MITSETARNTLNFILFQIGWFAPVAGPFAYWPASKLGDVSLPDLPLSLAALALRWLLVFPLLLFARKSLYPELT
ncbi:hypothetical protein [Marinobacter sp. KMM 10035]|uniref:hypothetical protein n=1 Tax=Marinobacter sp. KMM 10035 TaxID=3134034 RepID=UPI00397DE19C